MNFLRPALLATLLLVPRPAFAQESPPSEPLNPDPGPCCGCLIFTINDQIQIPRPKDDLVPAARELNGDYTIKLAVDVGFPNSYGEPVSPPPSPDPCANVRITSIYLVADGPFGWGFPVKVYSADGNEGIKHYPADVAAATGTVTIPGFNAEKAREFQIRKWKVVVACDGTLDPATGITVFNCSRPFTLDCGCKSCTSASCEPTAKNGCFTLDIPVGNADGGDTTGTIRFFSNEISQPNLESVMISVPSSVSVIRTLEDGQHSHSPENRYIEINVTTPTTKIVLKKVNGYDPITITHSHTGGGDFRITTVALVSELVNGVTTNYLRADSVLGTIANPTSIFRYQQGRAYTSAANGNPAIETYTLDSGPVDVSTKTFTVMRREILEITYNADGTQTHRETVAEEGATVSDIATTWENFPWGWDKTIEVIDPVAPGKTNAANLTSTWSFYAAGENTGIPNDEDTTTEGYGQLKEYVRYDGYREAHYYWPSAHATITPFAGDVGGLTTTRSWDSNDSKLITSRVACGNVISVEDVKFVDSPTAPSIINTTHANDGDLVTTTTLMPFGLSCPTDGWDFGGQRKSVAHPDGTLTTYTYQRGSGSGSKTVTVKNGNITNLDTSGGTVAYGTTTITCYNSHGTPVAGSSTLHVTDSNPLITDSYEATEDSFGRALVTTHFPQTTGAYTTAAEYNCCGVEYTTDMHGVKTFYAYDGLRRRIKTNTLNVTTQTTYGGLTTETRRYPESCSAGLLPTLNTSTATLTGRTTRNLAGTFTISESPNPSSTVDGALTATTSYTRYNLTYTAGVLVAAATTTELTVAGHSQITVTHPDGRTYQTAGALAQCMTYGYTVNGSGLLTTQAYLVGATIENGAIVGGSSVEASTIQTDRAGRTTDSAKGTISYHYEYYTAPGPEGQARTGKLKSVRDADNVRTLYDYNPAGERTTTAISLNGDDVIDYNSDQITVTETVPSVRGTTPVLATNTSVIATDGSATPVLASTTSHTPDGLSTWSATPAAAIGLNFCGAPEAGQISDAPADGLANWTDSWLVRDGDTVRNLFRTGTAAALVNGGAVRVTWQSSGTASAGSQTNNEQALYSQYLADGQTDPAGTDLGGSNNDGIGIRVKITGLADWLVANGLGSYQIRVYCSTDSDNGRFPAISIRDGDAASQTILGTIKPAVKGQANYPAAGGSLDPRGYGDSSADLTANTITLTVPMRDDTIRGTIAAIKITGLSTTATTSTLGLNRTETTTRPDGTKTATTYSGGRPLTVNNYAAGGSTALHTTTYGYETAPNNAPTLNRLTAVNDSRTGLTTTAFVSSTCDAVASITEENGGDDRTTLFTYDSRGNRISTTHPDSSITHNRYNSKGQLEATWGSLAYATVYSYDYAGRQLTLRTSPDINNNETANDPDDDFPADSGGAVTRWQYDATTGLLTGKFYDYREAAPPITANLTDGPTYSHTAGGRLQTRTWKRNITTNYYYNLGGQLRAIDYSDSTPDVLYTRDRLGRMATVAQGSLAVANGTLPVDDDGITISALRGAGYTYDPGDFHLATEALDYGNGFTKSLTRYVDAKGRLRSLKVGADYAAAYGHDSAGRLSQVWDHPTLNGGEPAGNASFSYGYVNNSNALVETVTGPAHTVTNIWEPTRDVLSTKINEVTATTPHTIPSSFAYGVNAIGQRETMDPVFENGSPISVYTPQWGWDYNNRGELVEAHDKTTAANDRAYQYDDIGNRKETANGLLKDLTGTPNYAANPLNQYTATPFATTAPVFDADGNLTEDRGANKESEDRQYVWDAENRLVAVNTVTSRDGAGGILTTAPLVTYAYDHLSRLVVRTTSAGTTRYLYDGWNLIAEYVGTTLAKSYTWGMDLSGSMQGAGGVGGLLAVNDGTATYYPTFDGNGNISEYLQITTFDDPLTTEVNEQVVAVVAHFEYDPFGNLTVDTEENAASFPYRFSTKPQDPVTGLYYYGYRYYDPLTGRWPSRDPIGVRGGLNVYGFVGNDVLNRVDLLGRIMTDESISMHYEPVQPQSLPSLPPISEDTVTVLMLADTIGSVILAHWIDGSGTKISRTDGEWGEYMKRNELLRSQLKTELLHDAANRTTSGQVDITFHAEVENSYFTGYGLLHGTDKTLGDFHISGQASMSEVPRKTQYKNIKFTWNDTIDPNTNVFQDPIFAFAIRLVSAPADYPIEINWHAESEVCVDTKGVTTSGYPFEKP